MECDPETVEVIRKGLYYSEMSGGVFDITIGKVTDLWDFHAEEPEVPAEDELREACDTSTAADYPEIYTWIGERFRFLDDMYNRGE